MTAGPLSRSRRSRGASLQWRGLADYSVTGPRWLGAVMLLEAVQEDAKARRSTTYDGP